MLDLVFRWCLSVAVLLGSLAGLLAGCVTNPGADASLSQPTAVATGEKFADRHVELIVADLVTAMVQVQELAPLTTTLQVSEPRGVFGDKLVEALETIGYGLQYVSEDQGVNYVSYANRSIVSNAGFVQDFLVRAGGIELTREYDVQEGNVVPTSIMHVKGTSSFNNILLNQNIFLQQAGPLDFENGVEVELLDASVILSPVMAVSQASNEIGNQPAAEPGITATLLDAKNMAREESEQQLLDNKAAYKPTRLAAVQFADDSLQLGRQNKAIINKLQKSIDIVRDVVFINSCSAGQIVVADSAADLRAERIKDELLLLGTPSQLIALEGCIEAQYPEAVVSPRTVMVMQRRSENPVYLANDLLKAFPAHPLAMTIPYGAGGATDFQARIVTMIAAEKGILGQPITIVNKPGQGGRAGWTWFAETAADTGYDIATYNVPHFIAQSIKFSTPYNIDTLEPLGNWGADPAVLVVPANSPFTTLRDYLLYARRNPGSVTVSGAGLYVGHHIAMLQLEKAAQVKLDYRTGTGGADALRQVVDGEVMSGFNNMSDVFRLGNQVRTLAIADLERNAYMPNVPTFKELVVDIDNSSVNYRGIMVPKGTSQEVIDILSEAVIKMFESPVVIERMKEGGSPLKIMTREEVTTMWQERQDYLAKLLKGR